MNNDIYKFVDQVYNLADVKKNIIRKLMKLLKILRILKKSGIISVHNTIPKYNQVSYLVQIELWL